MNLALRSMIVALAAVAALSAGCASPRPKPAAAPPFAMPDVAVEIGAELQRSAASWNTGNLDGFISIYADTATFALADSYLQGRLAIRDFYAGNFAPGAVRDELAFEKLDIEALSPDAALVRGIYKNTRHGQLTRRGTTTLIFRRIGGWWRIVHDHTN